MLVDFWPIGHPKLSQVKEFIRDQPEDLRTRIFKKVDMLPFWTLDQALHAKAVEKVNKSPALYEYKITALRVCVRILFCVNDNHYLLVHAFKGKHGRGKLPQKELDTAIKRINSV